MEIIGRTEGRKKMELQWCKLDTKDVGYSLSLVALGTIVLYKLPLLQPKRVTVFVFEN